MTRLRILGAAGLLFLLAVVSVGCGAEATAEKKTPFEPSKPPKDWLEERTKAREAATPPPTGK